MKIIYITGLALLAFLRVQSQVISSDTTAYKSKKIKIEEINLISSYYKQDGDNSAVMGGVGSEKLTDISNSIDVRLIKYDSSRKKHTLDLELGLDHYTSASSDMIDLQANSSASSADNRFYPSVGYAVENEERGTMFGAGVSSSIEYDYQSYGGNVAYSRKSKDRNAEFAAKFQMFLDQVKLILPVELRTGEGGKGSAGRNTFAGTISYSQIVNRNFQILLMADIISQSGYLGLPFHRVYFDDGTLHQEKLPDSRLKIPVSVRTSYFFGEHMIIRAYYRFYTDDWGINSHTADIEIPIKVTSFFSLSPFFRYYNQSASKYFDGFEEHSTSDEFYTSNHDLSKFNSNFFGIGLKYSPPAGVLGLAHFHTVEFRYGHYTKDIGMTADIVTVNIKYR